MDITKTIKIDDYLIINYTELSLDQKKALLEIRNSESIRKWMIDNSIISLDQHLSFIGNLEKSSTNYYYAVLKSNEIFGGISVTNWDSKQRTCEWGCFLNPKFFGFGLKLGYLFIILIFHYYINICNNTLTEPFSSIMVGDKSCLVTEDQEFPTGKTSLTTYNL